MIKLTEPYVGIEETEAVRRVFESGWLAEGPKTLLFEQAIAEYTGADYAVAVSNATVGLELCLRANKIKGKNPNAIPNIQLILVPTKRIIKTDIIKNNA